MTATNHDGPQTVTTAGRRENLMPNVHFTLLDKFHQVGRHGLWPSLSTPELRDSGVLRILEWEGSRCRRGKGLGRGLCPFPRKFFVFFC